MKWQFSIEQEGLVVASGEASSEEDCRREAGHYAFIYEQDGPVKVTVTHGMSRMNAAMKEEFDPEKVEREPMSSSECLAMWDGSGPLNVVRESDYDQLLALYRAKCAEVK